MAEYRKITASHVGAPVAPMRSDMRVCKRCGRVGNVGNKALKKPVWMCVDCKSVDRGMAQRLGLV